MKTKLNITIYLICILIIYSCKKDTNFSYQNETSIIKNATTEWILQKRVSTDIIKSSSIDSLLSNLNWNNLQIDHVNDSIQFAYVPLLNNEKKGLSIIYNSFKQRLDTSNLLSIQPLGSNVFDFKSLYGIYSKQSLTKTTGIINIYSVQNEFESKLGVLDGKIIFKSEFRRMPSGQKDRIKTFSNKSNTEICYDTYYVTQLDNGELNWLFLYQTCSSGCDLSFSIKLASETSIKGNCGGGGTSTLDGRYTNELQYFEIDYKSRMSATELFIYEHEMTFSQRVSYLLNAQLASTLAQAIYPTSIQNGKGDAYRHSLFVALNAQTLGLDLAQRLSDAHENNNTPEILQKEMDLRNNQVGLNMYSSLIGQYPDYLSYLGALQVMILLKINNGDLWIISDLDTYLNPTINSRLIQSNE